MARAQIKNELDHCHVTRMKLELLQNNKDAMVAKYGETDYNNRVTDLIDRLLEDPTTVNNHDEASSSVSNGNDGNTYSSA